MECTIRDDYILLIRRKMNPKKTEKVGSNVSITLDRGKYIRLQFSSGISQKIWGIKQKYFALKLDYSPENWLKAKEIGGIVERDILFDTLDPTFDKYKICENAAKKAEINGWVPGRAKIPDILSLYDLYLEEKRNQVEETTFLRHYQGVFRNAIRECPHQKIEDVSKICSFLVENRCPSTASRTIRTLSEAVEWAKDNDMLPVTFKNQYKSIAAKVSGNDSRRKKPKQIRDIGAANTSDYRAFTKKERDAIIQAFEERGKKNKRGAERWANVLRFLFWTGCRHGEICALKWKHINKDCSKIFFQASMDVQFKIEKGLKTKRCGVSERMFPCNQKLQELLLSLRPDDYDPESYIFEHNNKPLQIQSLGNLWSGRDNKNGIACPSEIARLIEAGKVEQYLIPYATRHTFITLQLEAGVPIQNVAKWVGNSPATILKHYQSFCRDFSKPADI